MTLHYRKIHDTVEIYILYLQRQNDLKLKFILRYFSGNQLIFPLYKINNLIKSFLAEIANKDFTN